MAQFIIPFIYSLVLVAQTASADGLGQSRRFHAAEDELPMKAGFSVRDRPRRLMAQSAVFSMFCSVCPNIHRYRSMLGRSAGSR